MEFNIAFGEDRVLRWGGLIEATDRICPNLQLDNKEYLLKNFNSFVTLPQYLIERFHPAERRIILSVMDYYGRYDYALIAKGKVIALKSIIDGFPQYFLSNTVFELLKQSGFSIVRFYGKKESPSYLEVIEDTRFREYKLSMLEELRFHVGTLYHEYKGYYGISCDIVTKAKDLVGVTKYGYDWIVKGTTAEWEFLINFIRENFSKGEVPFNLKTIKECYYDGDIIMAGVRSVREGIEIFLAKECYEFLKDRGLAILRGRKKEDKKDFEELKIVFHPEVMP